MASGVLTGTSMIKKAFIEARILELTEGYKVTDAVFATENTDALAITYEDPATQVPSAESDVAERNEFGQYPRIGMGTAEKTAMIKDYGLEILLSYNAVTKNQIASINRAYTKLGNSLVRFVDQAGLKTLTDNYNASSTKVNTQAAGAAWSSGSADPFKDLMLAKAKVNSQDNQYAANVALVHPDDLTNAMLVTSFRQAVDTDLAPEEKILKSGLIHGKIAGLILVEARNITKGNIWVGETNMVGSRFQNTNGIETDQYRTSQAKKADYVVSAFREFTDVLTDPKAGTLLSGV